MQPQKVKFNYMKHVSYIYYKLSLREQEIFPLSTSFALFVANHVLITFRRANVLAYLVLYSRKLFLIPLSLYFKNWVG